MKEVRRSAVLWLLGVLSSSAAAAPAFRVIDGIPGRAPSAHYAAWVRPAGSYPGDANWTQAFVLETTSQPDSQSVARGCGYFDHLDGWTASWLSVEMAAGPGGAGIEVRVQRLFAPHGSTTTDIQYAAVHPVSSGATVLAARAHDDDVAGREGFARLGVPAPARFTVDFDGGLDDVDTGPAYKPGGGSSAPPMHTFSVFAEPLDAREPAAGDAGVVAVAPGEALPTAGSLPPNATLLLLLPGEHRGVAPGAHGWPRYSLPANVNVHVPAGAILYAALDSGGAWGRQNVSLSGHGVVSGEEMSRCPNRTDASVACSAACPTNTSPQGLTLTGVTQASITGVTFVDFPNHHLIAQATGCAPKQSAALLANVKVLGWRANGDGVHVFGGWDVRDLFLRTQDDSLYLHCGDAKAGCAQSTFRGITTWNDANGASFMLNGNGTRLLDSDVIYARASWGWWSGGRVFSHRGTGMGGVYNVSVEGLRVEDRQPSLNMWQVDMLTGSASGLEMTDVTFTDVHAAAYSTVKLCGTSGGCNCQPACAKGGALPDGIPNVLLGGPNGKIRGWTFTNVSIAGTSIAAALTQPGFNYSRDGSVSNIVVDGKKVIV